MKVRKLWSCGEAKNVLIEKDITTVTHLVRTQNFPKIRNVSFSENSAYALNG